MYTKKIIFAALLCAPAFIQAQGLYLGVDGGYGFPAAKMSIFGDYKSTNGSTNTYEATSKPVSFGKGVNAGLYIGYMLNENVGMELGASYLIGSKYTFTDETTNDTGPSSSKYEDTWKAHMIRLVPTLRMTSGENKLHPYAKAGLIIGIGGKLFEESHNVNTDPSGSTVIDENWEYSGGISLGFHGGLGINYMVSDKIGIFLEAAGNYQSWAMKKGIMTVNTVDGVDQLSMLTTAEKETEFVDEVKYDYNNPPSDSQPTQSTKFFMPLSSIGVNIGLHIAFGGSGE